MSDVLHQGCQKLGLKGDQYVLRHNNKLIDLSLTYRLSSLPAGAQLTLVQASRSPTVITVALQLPASSNNRRIQHKFPSNTSLWEILRVIETKENINLTERASPPAQSEAGRLLYEIPVLNFMNRELANFVDLQKTLGQLGVSSGNVLLRLEFRDSGLPLEEAMLEISRYFKSDDRTPMTRQTLQEHPSAISETGASAVAAPGMESEGGTDAKDIVMEVAPLHPPEQDTIASTTTAAVSGPESTQVPRPTESAPSASEGSQTSQPATSITVYTLPPSSTPMAAQQAWNESDYIPTVEHAKTHQARLLQETRNRRLPSDVELARRELDRKTKQDSVSSVRVRIRLPDQTIVETTFEKTKCSGKHVYDTIRLQMRDGLADSLFSLRYVDGSGAHVVLPDDEKHDIIVNGGWRGSVLVSLVWDASMPADKRKGPVLKSEALEQAKTLTVQAPKADVEPDKKGGLLGGIFKKDGSKDKQRMGPADMEAKLKGFLGFKKK
jgi:tether containing UBX domain for GLUT4